MKHKTDFRQIVWLVKNIGDNFIEIDFSIHDKSGNIKEYLPVLKFLRAPTEVAQHHATKENFFLLFIPTLFFPINKGRVTSSAIGHLLTCTVHTALE